MKKFLALLMTLAMCLSLAACGGSSTPANSGSNAAGGDSEFPTMTWKFTTSATENTALANIGRDFGQMVNEATGGAITVDVYPADQLTSGSQPEGIQAVMDGTIDLSVHSNLIYSNFEPKLNVISLPFLFSSYEDVDAKLDGDAGAAVGEVVTAMGLHMLGIAENGFRQVTNNARPIASVGDMKGLKIRVAASSLLNREYELWGANYTNANWSEVYTGLQTGTYDGQENPLPTADGAAIAEVQNYVTCWTGVYDCMFFTMNGELYNSLSPELQKIVDECGLKAVQNQRAQVRADNEEVLKRWQEEKGVTVTELTPEAAEEFRQAALPCYTEFADILTQDLIDVFTK